MPRVNRKSPPSSPRGYTIDIQTVTADLTITRVHSDLLLQVDSASDVTITLARDLPVGMIIQVEQAGTGQAIFAAGADATMVSRSGHDRTAGRYAVMGAYVRDNSDGISAEWLLTGDGA